MIGYACVGTNDWKRALAFYLRIGYRKVSDTIRRVHWKFTDSEGNLHEGRDWNLDLVKVLTPP